jgi:nitrogenase molybdenum-cofactor synthesis protein NifE
VAGQAAARRARHPRFCLHLGDAKYREVAYSHRARAAMMVCSKAMINVARKMEERYGIPFFEGSFYGIGRFQRELREIARLLVERGAPDDIDGAHRSGDRARGGARLGRDRALQAALQGQEVCSSPAASNPGRWSPRLQEAGLELVGTSVKKSTKKTRSASRRSWATTPT